MEYVDRRILRDDKTRPNVGNTLVKLPAFGGCTRCVLEFRATNGGSGNATNPLSACLGDIAIEDNHGNVLVRASAAQLIALDQLLTGLPSANVEADTADADQIVYIPINFGRMLNDPQIGLNLKRLDGATIQIAVNLEIVRACGATGFVSGSLLIDADLHQTLSPADPGYAACIYPVDLFGDSDTVVEEKTYQDMPKAGLASLWLYCYKSGQADVAMVERVRLLDSSNDNTLLDSTFQALVHDTKLSSGAALAHWACLKMAPGRNGEETLNPFNRIRVKPIVNQLQTGGKIRFLAEVVR